MIGARFVSGTGELVAGGGRVVKNAAGFDLPKMLVGSLGRLGVIVELSLKVLPAPPAWGTLRADLPDLSAALEAIARLGTAGLDVEALDLEPPGRLWVRLGGPRDGLEARLARAERVLAHGGERLLRDRGERLLGGDEAEAWTTARELAWAPPGASVAKVATTPSRVPDLDAGLARLGAARRYSAGGHLCWVAWPAETSPEALGATLRELGASGVRLTGPPGAPLLGVIRGGEFGARSRRALDPGDVFAPYGEF